MLSWVPRTLTPGRESPIAPFRYGTAGSAVPWNARIGMGRVQPSWNSTATVAMAATRDWRAHE